MTKNDLKGLVLYRVLNQSHVAIQQQVYANIAPQGYKHCKFCTWTYKKLTAKRILWTSFT